MNILDLRQAQIRFENRIESIIKSKKELYKLRSSFVKYFNNKRLSEMKIDDYVAGVPLPKTGYNFCYTLERKLDGLGRISGAYATMFGVYYGKWGESSSDTYQFTKKFGSNYVEAFEGVTGDLKPGKSVALLVQRRSGPVFLAIRPEDS